MKQMKPVYKDSVKATCPDCGAVTSFEPRVGGGAFGVIIQEGRNYIGGVHYDRTAYILMRCASCGRGGMAAVHYNDNISTGGLGEFHPITVSRADLPTGIPQGIVKEYREAERCAAIGAWRGASALLRSTLEKVLKENGYAKGTLEEKIDAAAQEGVIAASLQQAAHDDVRILGNDVLHDEWREVTDEEVTESHRYVQRILEAFYDQRPTVEKVLKAKGRLTPPAVP